MTPASYYTDLARSFDHCQDRMLLEPGYLIPPDIYAGLERIMAIAEEVARRFPEHFTGRAELIFMAMAYPIMVSVAAGEMVPLSSIQNCIQAYTGAAADKSIIPPKTTKGTQYCRLRGGPCEHCVDMYRTCRNFYEVA